MTKREQITHDTLNALIRLLDKRDVIETTEREDLEASIRIGEAREAEENAPPGVSVRREKISADTRELIASAYDDLEAAREDDEVGLDAEVAALETIVDALVDVITGDTLEELGAATEE
jgi:hypothetical protein